MNPPFDRLSRPRYSEYLRASEEERHRFNFQQFIEERRNYVGGGRPQIGVGQTFGRPSLLGNYPGDPDHTPLVKKPRSRSVGRHPYYLNNESNFNTPDQSTNQMLISDNYNDLVIDENHSEKSVEINSSNDKDATNKEKPKIVFNDNKTSQNLKNEQKDSSHASPTRKVIKSDTSIKISAVLNNLPNSSPNKVNSDALANDRFKKFYGKSITDVDDSVGSKVVRLPILEWSCDAYNYNSIPEYNKDSAVGGDGISIELFYMCKYCKMFASGLEIQHHLKSQYHYDKYKEYLRTGTVLSSSESDDGSEAVDITEKGNLKSKQKSESISTLKSTELLSNKITESGNINLTNNAIKTETDLGYASGKSESINLDIDETKDLLKLPEVDKFSSSTPNAQNRSRSRNVNRQSRFNQLKRNDNYRNQPHQNWRNSRKSDFDMRRSRFNDSQSSRLNDSFQTRQREKYGKSDFDSESKFNDISLKDQFEIMKSQLNSSELLRWQADKRVDRRDIDDDLYNVHQELDFD